VYINFLHLSEAQNRSEKHKSHKFYLILCHDPRRMKLKRLLFLFGLANALLYLFHDKRSEIPDNTNRNTLLGIFNRTYSDAAAFAPANGAIASENVVWYRDNP
jgi:hypothetical protein